MSSDDFNHSHCVKNLKMKASNNLQVKIKSFTLLFMTYSKYDRKVKNGKIKPSASFCRFFLLSVSTTVSVIRCHSMTLTRSCHLWQPWMRFILCFDRFSAFLSSSRLSIPMISSCALFYFSEIKYTFHIECQEMSSWFLLDQFLVECSMYGSCQGNKHRTDRCGGISVEVISPSISFLWRLWELQSDLVFGEQWLTLVSLKMIIIFRIKCVFNRDGIMQAGEAIDLW